MVARLLRCPGCQATARRPMQYLCRTCWWALPPVTRRALRQTDDRAARRYRQLLTALRAGTSPAAVEVES